MVKINTELIDQWLISHQSTSSIEKIKELYQQLKKEQLDNGDDKYILKNDILEMSNNFIDANLWKSITSSKFISDLLLVKDYLQGYDNTSSKVTNIDDYIQRVKNNIESIINNSDDDQDEIQLALLITGITLLNLYVQINWTGPTPKDLPIKNRDGTFSNQDNQQQQDNPKEGKELYVESNATLYKQCRLLLEVDGEPCYSKVKYPILLILARLILVDSYQDIDRCRSSCWWSCRCLMYHQRTLQEPTPSLKATINDRFQIVSRFYVDNHDESSDESIDLAAQAKLEQSLAFHYYRQLTKSKTTIQEASKISQLDVELSGALGRRTRFQTFDTAQLILQINNIRNDEKDNNKENNQQNNDNNNSNNINNNNNNNNNINNNNQQNSNNNNQNNQQNNYNQIDKDGNELKEFDENHRFKREITNDDPTLLSRPKLKDIEYDKRNPRIIDQAILISQCLNIKNQNPNIGLTTEEMMPYMHKVLERSNNWIIHSQALLIKSRLETTSSKTVDRAALQVQALVDQYDQDESSGAPERLAYIYATDYPTRWDLEKEVGERFIAIGAAATAFEIFERLEMWSDAIKCLTVMGKHARSEELVRARLEVEPTPELWCVLADIKEDPQYYIRGWEHSGKRYSRAQRSLGHYHLKRCNWNEAIEAYLIALSINSLFPGSWFSCGCAAMRVERFDVALNAFSRVISLEPEEAEAYGNLASIYMYQGKMDKAFTALTEGIKHRRDSWKMWENYLNVSMAIKEYQTAVNCVLQVFDLADKRLDLHIVQTLANHVIEDTIDRQGINGRRMEKSISEMFGKITSKLTSNADLWAIYSDYHTRLGNLDKAVDLQQRAFRTIESSSSLPWDKELPLFEKVIKYFNTMVQLYLKQQPVNPSNIYSAKLKIKNIFKKVELSNFNESNSFKLLLDLQSQLDSLDNK